MNPQELAQLRFALSSGAPVDPSTVVKGCTIDNISEAMSGVDVCFRDYGVGAFEVKELAEPDSKGFVGMLKVASTVEIPDRAGDIVRVRGSSKPRVVWDPQVGEREVTPGGFRTGNFMAARGPVLWAHNRDESLPPVGEVVKSKAGKVETKKYGNRNAVIQTVGLRPDEDLPISKTIARLAMLGSLKTVSVGFAKVHVDFVRDPAERAKRGLGAMGIDFVTSDQAELSFTPTPMNPLAVVLGASKSAEELIGREVDHGLSLLLGEGVLSRNEHEAIRHLLLPMSGDARAAAKVGSFVDFGACVRSTGLWPGDDDTDRTRAEEARRAVEIRSIADPSQQEEVEEPEAVSEVKEMGQEEVASEVAPNSNEDEGREREKQAEAMEGLRKQLHAEREVSARLREEVRVVRGEAQVARDALNDNPSGVLTRHEHDLLWAAYESIATVEGTIGSLVETLTARINPPSNALRGAGSDGSVTSDVERLLAPALDRLLQQRGIEGRVAPATVPGSLEATPGDALDVGLDGRTAIRQIDAFLADAGA